MAKTVQVTDYEVWQLGRRHHVYAVRDRDLLDDSELLDRASHQYLYGPSNDLKEVPTDREQRDRF